MKPGRPEDRRFREDSRPQAGPRLLRDESGQDLIEHALLGALVGVASILTWKVLVTTVGNVYSTANADVQSVSTCTPDPGGGGC
jgi:Flp pilus assembly pilin Flp